ncbi:A disintegrin and metalloproteinase with thrombospondin motifs adt-1-like [Ruditapes philippinarum]|uniref:A disintegrin and metalloproteinase with thrombospondin motifs adt-1-like n=1 Tax=Ruditapes philippinarum TaxID=129788 RepID=UPI00295B7096|nr:A disintegrin and metalloproteinase with thrombospondin motifs adt-1-like [Ruditapes philippinarum]
MILLVITIICSLSVSPIFADINESDGEKWNEWLPWDGCSSPCSTSDVGIQSRRRTCSTSIDDDACSGESVDYRTCKIKSRNVLGDWGAWLSWEGCSVSCDIGLQRRKRTCLNQLSDDEDVLCTGESIDFKICTEKACADGGWTSWREWNSCSATCGWGVSKRERSCSNPRPSVLGQFCDGSPEQTRSCQNSPCSDARNDTSNCKTTMCSDYGVAFTATNIIGGSSRQTMKFFRVPVNYGNDFSGATGLFTCRIPGLYAFSVTLSREDGIYGNVHAYLRVSNVSPLTLFSQIVGQYSMSATGTYHLNKNDVVYVDGNPNYFNGGTYSYFSGFLIKPDQ